MATHSLAFISVVILDNANIHHVQEVKTSKNIFLTIRTYYAILVSGLLYKFNSQAAS